MAKNLDKLVADARETGVGVDERNPTYVALTAPGGGRDQDVIRASRDDDGNLSGDLSLFNAYGAYQGSISEADARKALGVDHPTPNTPAETARPA